jgi:hypothetical protein
VGRKESPGPRDRKASQGQQVLADRKGLKARKDRLDRPARSGHEAQQGPKDRRQETDQVIRENGSQN